MIGYRHLFYVIRKEFTNQYFRWLYYFFVALRRRNMQKIIHQELLVFNVENITMSKNKNYKD